MINQVSDPKDIEILRNTLVSRTCKNFVRFLFANQFVKAYLVTKERGVGFYMVLTIPNEMVGTVRNYFTLDSLEELPSVIRLMTNNTLGPADVNRINETFIKQML